MKKTILLTPGPTPIPESVLAVLAQPIIHHRTPAFEKIMKEVRTGLQGLFQTRQEVLLVAGSGTSVMEASVANLFSPGDHVITINGGKFGERWTKICTAYGLTPIEIKLIPGSSLPLEELARVISENPSAKAILFQASETSTGVEMPVQKICQLAQEAQMLAVCDGITACGVIPLPMDTWGIDVLITGSQKALMLPPGLALISLSEKAWVAAERATLPRFYLDLRKEKKSHLKNQTTWTPAISLIIGLQESLRLLHEEGLENVYQRHLLLARATRAAVQALGLEILAKGSPSTAVTAVQVPKSISDGKKIPKLMRERYGVLIAGGQDELEGKIFRLSHFGYCGPFDVITGICALEFVLRDLHYSIEFGQGVRAAQQVFAEATRER